MQYTQRDVRHTRQRRFYRCAVVGIASLLVAGQTLAADYILTIGGGYSPSGNQVSLEKNVLFFQRLLSTEAAEAHRHDIYFADGDRPARDLQFANPEAVPDANRFMAELFGKTDHLELEYRNHEIPGLRGSSNEANIDQWFEEVGSRMQRGDRLILYATAHGGKSRDRKKSPYNTRLYLWNSQSISVADLAKRIERLPEGVSVVLVMVQCYSGGFASAIFQDADTDHGAVPRDLCGFFATVHDRPAAGCTADIDEENYQEYSSFFWAAISGTSRLGELVQSPDYDGDGEVSFDEAHAYVILTSDTIDIPTKTSGMFLRVHSELSEDDTGPELLSAKAPFSEISRHASPVEAAILTGLSSQLGLSSEDRQQSARQLAKQIEQERKKLYDRVRRKQGDRKRHRDAITRDLKARWPELANTLSATATQLMTARAAEFVDAVVSHRRYSDYRTLGEEIDALEKERFSLRRRWTKCQRLVRTLENVALAHNLPMVADEQTVARFERLVQLEASRFSVQPLQPSPL